MEKRADTTTTILIDTNVFIHLRDIKDIPWAKIFPDIDQIDVRVSMGVIKQLDALKVGTNGRKRDRARAALRLIDEATENQGMAKILRAGLPLVRLVVTAGPTIVWDDFPTLQAGDVDHEIVALASIYDGMVFSHDSGPRIKARELGVNVLKPKEEWHLPLEKSDKDKKIEQLERAARERNPDIKLQFLHQSIRNDGRVEFVVPRLPPRTEPEIEEFLHRVLAIYPKVQIHESTALDLALGSGYTAGDCARYDRDYKKFQDGLEKYFRDQHKLVAAARRMACVTYSVLNDSGIAAQGLRLDFSLKDGVGLQSSAMAHDFLRDAGLVPPKPPEPPRKTRFGEPYHIPRFDFQTSDLVQPKDLVGFYWMDQPSFSRSTAALQCMDFRARRTWENQIFVVLPVKGKDFGELTISASATNMTNPQAIHLPYVVVESDSNWDDEEIVTVCSALFEAGAEDD